MLRDALGKVRFFPEPKEVEFFGEKNTKPTGGISGKNVTRININKIFFDEMLFVHRDKDGVA